MLLSDEEANQGGYVATEGAIQENETEKESKKKRKST